jgi:hypothetical protein
MPKRPHTELNCSPDGPWITIHGETGSLTVNFREVMRGEMFAASPSRKRIIGEWIKARDAEGTTANANPPDAPIGVKLGPRAKARSKS